MAETKPAETTAVKPTTAAELSAAFPELCAAIHGQGAAAESSRITGIEALMLPGYEKIVAECKADASVTPEQAAVRIIAAQRETSRRQMTAIQDVEKTTGVVKPSPLASADAPEPEPPKTPEGWAEEYKASATLQSEFATAAHYIAFKNAEASGKVKILRK